METTKPEKKAPEAKTARKIVSANLHVAQNIDGRVRNTVMSEALSQYPISITETPYGLLFVGEKTRMLVPYGNVQSYNYES